MQPGDRIILIAGQRDFASGMLDADLSQCRFVLLRGIARHVGAGERFQPVERFLVRGEWLVHRHRALVMSEQGSHKTDIGLEVAQTTLGLSSYTSAENIDRQATQFDKLLNYSDFQDPAKLRNFLQRFAAQYDLANPTASSSPLVSAFASSSGASATFSVSLLMSMQNLKLGG